MRVLMLGWEWPPHVSGGLGVACAGLARGLASLGTEVAFVVPSLSGDEDAGAVRLVGALPANAGGLRPSAYAGGPGPSDGGGRAGRYGEDLLRSVGRFSRDALGASSGLAFDVVHGHDWTSFPAARACADARGAPLVLHVHSIEQDRSGPSEWPEVAEIERRTLRRAEAVVCVSRYTARTVAARYAVAPARLHVVHNAVDPPRGTPDDADGRGRPRRAEALVLFAGRITRQKGPAVFLDAAAKILSVAPRTRFLVAGTGDLFGPSVERAADLGIARRVRFAGRLSAQEMEHAFARADVYVMPSASEPFGLAAVEAAARGVPVVVSSAAGALESVPSALRADFRSAEDVADKVLGALLRPALREHLRARARAEAVRLDWRGQAARVHALYERLVG